MKRSREEDDLSSQRKIVIGSARISRPTDLSQVPIENRFFVAHQNIANRLDLPETLAKEAWMIMQSIAEPKGNPYLWSATAIWIVKICSINHELQDFTLDQTFSLSRILLALKSCCSEFKSPTVYHDPIMDQWLRQIASTVSAVRDRITPTLYNNLDVLAQTIHAEYIAHRDLNSKYRQLLTILNVDLDTNRDLNVKRYGWVMFLIIAEQLAMTPYEKSCAILLVAVFVASQVAQTQKPMEQVYPQLFDNLQPLESNYAGKPWGEFQDLVINQVIAKLNPEISSKILHEFLMSLDYFKQKNCIYSDEPDLMGSHWKTYKNAFETGYIEQNLQVLISLHTRLTSHKKIQLDLRAFTPSNVIETLATPRAVKTPLRSISNTPAASKKLWSASTGSGVGEAMKATPLTTPCAKIFTKSKVECFGDLTKFLREKPSSVLGNLNLLGLTDPPPQEVQSRVKMCVDFFVTKYPSAKDAFDLGSRLYGYLFSCLVNINPQMWQPLIFGDRCFQRNLICISLEVARFCFASDEIYFRELLTVIQVSLIDLCLLLDLLIRIENWLPRFLVKRFTEIQERIFEADIWEDTVFCKFLAQRILQKPIMYHETITARLHHSVIDPSNSNAIDSILYLFNKILDLARVRLDFLAKQINMSADITEKTWTLIHYCLTNEHILKLIVTRNLDAILLASTHTMLAVCNLPLDYAEIEESYKLQPQYMSQTLYDITLNQGKKGTIKNFIQLVYLPKVSAYLDTRGYKIPTAFRFQSPAPRCGSPMKRTPSKAGVKLMFSVNSPLKTEITK